jgi:hypothetical protein
VVNQFCRGRGVLGKVAIHHERDASLQEIATIQVVSSIEGAATGLALNASASMKRL